MPARARKSGRHIRAGLFGAGSLLLAWPSVASAHGGLELRANLPIPEWLFGWAAAIVLVVSFAALAVLWPKPRLEEIDWRPLPGLGRILGSRPVEIICGTIGVALLALLLWAGFTGTDAPRDNLTPTFVLIIFWVGLVFVSALFGDVFRAFNPWRAIGRVLRFDGIRPYPANWGRWPAAFVLLGFTWIELASGDADHPDFLATAIALYTVFTLGMMFVYGTETWARYGEGFSVYFNLFARVSIFETRDRVLGLRPLLGGLPSLEKIPGTVAVVVVLIGTVTFDGLSQGKMWEDNLYIWLQDASTAIGLGADPAATIASTIGLLLGVGLVAGFYHLGIAGARTVGGDLNTGELRRAFVHSLVPIAMVYAMAHYLSLLVFEGQSIIYLASDPRGDDSDYFGTADAGIDFSVLSQNLTWYLQTAFVVLGHVAALVLAHDRALVLYGQAKQAVRSQYWMLGIMVGFTTLALWLLAQANA